jgi:hypothetical protein
MSKLNMSVKCVFNKDDIRRFYLKSCSMASLLATVTDLYPRETKSTFEIQYLDDEDALITIKSDSELVEAFNVARQQNCRALKLFVAKTAVAGERTTAVPARKGQLISIINAYEAVTQILKTTLGPRVIDKLIAQTHHSYSGSHSPSH